MTPRRSDASSFHTPLGEGREFSAIRELLARWADRALGVGDDCAVLDVPIGERLCVSTDSSVEDVHFRRAWLSAAEIGYRATTAALSDLAAMAARPLGALVALTVPDRWRGELGDLADGIGEATSAAGTVIVGGDTTGGSALTITVTVIGAAACPVERRGARPGDRVYVTGRLGGPGAALRAFERGVEPQDPLRARFAHPEARIREARWLADRGASAMIDVSDGLLADLGHVAAASGIRLVIDVDRVPRVAGASRADATGGGEEYELALTAADRLDAEAFAAAFGLPVTEIGCVEAGTAGVAAHASGIRVDLPAGYNHLSG